MNNQVREYVIDYIDVFVSALKQSSQLLPVNLVHWLVLQFGEYSHKVNEVPSQLRVSFEGLKGEFEPAVFLNDPFLRLMKHVLARA